ncbi:MAG TPA: hypothetical protein VK171_07150 [Fimbriimonas sp.]|nr:hypothetical protein [Fimbriimonas sp.]
MKLSSFVPMLLALFAVGCAKTSSTTVVEENGNWTRTVKYTIGKDPAGDKWMDVFALPEDGTFKKSEVTKESEKSTTLSKSYKVGIDPITDIIVKDAGVTRLKNYVMVREIAPGKFEYYEKIVFPEPKTDKMDEDSAKYIARIKEALPAGIATEEELKQLSKKSIVGLMRLMFGPDDHLFGTLLLNPDGAGRRLKFKIAKQQYDLLRATFGTKLTDEQLQATVKKLLADFDAQDVAKSNQPDPQSPTPQSNSDFIGISVAVKMPGTLVETNGDIDPLTGEVFWDLASNSAELEPVELRAVYQVTK